jgi:hypothetical protein
MKVNRMNLGQVACLTALVHASLITNTCKREKEPSTCSVIEIVYCARMSTQPSGRYKSLSRGGQESAASTFAVTLVEASPEVRSRA